MAIIVGLEDYTIQALWINFGGGKDVTSEVLASLNRPQS